MNEPRFPSGFQPITFRIVSKLLRLSGLGVLIAAGFGFLVSVYTATAWIWWFGILLIVLGVFVRWSVTKNTKEPRRTLSSEE